MHRRRFIVTAVGAGVTTALAGCAGYTVQRQADVEAREERIEDLEAAVDAQERELDERGTRIRRLEAERVSELYATGYDRFERAEAQFESGVANEAEGNYGLAGQSFSTARGDYESAKAAVDRAVSAAEEAGLDDARSLLAESAWALSFHAAAAENYAAENLFRQRGEAETADEFERDGDTASRSADERSVHGPETVDGTLGL